MLGRVIIAYRITTSAILIARVFYGGQDYEAILRSDDGDGDRNPESSDLR